MGLKEFRDLQAQKEESKISEGLQGEFLSLDTAKKLAKLGKENKQLKEVIEEVRGYIKDACYYYDLENYSSMTSNEVKELLQILDKGVNV